MRIIFLTNIVVLMCLYAVAQDTDTSITLRIIDEQICIDKKRQTLNFSYYFENKSTKNIAVVDYYDPCQWENQMHSLEGDSDKTLAVVLVLKDDSGQVVYPIRHVDTSKVLSIAQYKTDSSLFAERYNRVKRKDEEFQTSLLRPSDVLISLYTMRLNNRKCFQSGAFKFDYNRKYTVSVMYLATEDVYTIVDKKFAKDKAQVFVGKLISNSVELCFK